MQNPFAFVIAVCSMFFKLHLRNSMKLFEESYERAKNSLTDSLRQRGCIESENEASG